MTISAIVPVYNAEKYLSRCINSVINQTYADWELILVDDGSQDNSFQILQNYAKRDFRIRAVYQDNAGAGMARNVGIELVGESRYTVFLDADDYIEPNYFEMLSCYKEDVVFIDINRRNEDGNILGIEKMSVNKKKKRMTSLGLK